MNYTQISCTAAPLICACVILQSSFDFELEFSILKYYVLVVELQITCTTALLCSASDLHLCNIAITLEILCTANMWMTSGNSSTCKKIILKSELKYITHHTDLNEECCTIIMHLEAAQRRRAMLHKPCYKVLQPTRTQDSISILRHPIYSGSMNTLLAHYAIHRTCALYHMLLYTVMTVCV